MQPEDRLKTLEGGLALHRAGNFAGALDVYRRVLSALPGDPDALNLAADASFSLGKFNDAAGFFERLAATDRKDAQTRFNLGIACRQAGRNADAVAAFERVIGIDPIYPKANFNLGIALEADGRIEEAVAAYERAVSQDPQDAASTANLAGALAKMRAFNRALVIYDSAIERWPKEPTIRLMHAAALREVKLYDRAIEACEAALSVSPDNADAHATLGLTCALAGRHREAVDACRAALKIDPGRTATRIVLMGALIELEQFDEVLELSPTVPDEFPGHFTATRYRAVSLLGLGRSAEAVDVFRKLFDAGPEDIDVIAGYADALAQAGREREVAELYRSVVDGKPSAPEPYTEIGKRYLEAGEPGDAFKAVSEAVSRFPGDTGALAIQVISAVAAGENEVVHTLHDFDGLMARVNVDTPSGWSSVADFNQALSAHVQNHPSVTFAPADHATQDGYHTGELMLEPMGPVSGLEELIRGAVDSYVRDHPVDPGHPFLARHPGKYGLNIWAIILQESGHQIPHIHPAAWLSGVYYPQLPPVIDQNDTSGWIEFGRAPDRFSCGVEGDVITIQPREGLMILFPSYMYHRTIPFTGTGTRISVAFDVSITGM